MSCIPVPGKIKRGDPLGTILHRLLAISVDVGLELGAHFQRTIVLLKNLTLSIRIWTKDTVQHAISTNKVEMKLD